MWEFEVGPFEPYLISDVKLRGWSFSGLLIDGFDGPVSCLDHLFHPFFCCLIVSFDHF